MKKVLFLFLLSFSGVIYGFRWPFINGSGDTYATPKPIVGTISEGRPPRRHSYFYRFHRGVDIAGIADVYPVFNNGTFKGIGDLNRWRQWMKVQHNEGTYYYYHLQGNPEGYNTGRNKNISFSKRLARIRDDTGKLRLDYYKMFSFEKLRSVIFDIGKYFKKGGEKIFRFRYMGEDDKGNGFFELRVGHKDILWLNYKVILVVNDKGEIMALGRFETFRGLLWKKDKNTLIESYCLYDSYMQISGYNNDYYKYYLKKAREEQGAKLEKGKPIAVGKQYSFYYGYDVDWDGNIYVLYNGLKRIYLDKWEAEK